MSLTEFWALMPIIVIASISVVTMLQIAFKRHHRLTECISVIGYLLALILLFISPQGESIHVTPLLVIDAYSRFFIEIMLLASLCITLFSYAYLQQCDEQREEYYILLSLAVLGAAVLIASDHFASFFIGIELLSVSIFALVGYLVKDRSSRPHSLEASIKYMILSGVSSSFLLFGIALIYADTGVLQFAQLQTVISSHTFGGYSEIGFAMLVIGLGFKVSWVPFHMWTPDVYEGAPVPVSTFLATVSKLAVFASITRIYIGSGGDGFSALNPILIFIAMSSMLVGNGLALRQSNLKRLLAYSSIAHMGYLLVALLAAGNIVQQGDKQMALEAVGFYLVAYVIMSLVAFGVINLLSRPHDRMEAEYLDQYQGLFWRRPWLATSLSLSLLSLAGIPFTIGFIGKFYLIAAGVQHALWLLLAVLILSSAMSLFYYLGVIIRMSQPVIDSSPSLEKSITLREESVVLWGLVILLVGLGLYPQPLIIMVQHALVWGG